MIGVSEKLDPLFVLLSTSIAGFTLIPAWRRKHGRKTCLALFAAGILFLLVRRYTSRPFEIAATVFGAGLIVSAHALNIRFARRCRCCEQASVADPAIWTRSTGP
jgi:MerC mercury resistance protein